ncbi:phosphoribosylanthranilate isomerase [Pseudomonas sp. CCI3.2]|uniref:phosphoribosylanthranilate isomerase n=1 Tax=unclassified Pseudomonas TaxID=196821 RepID=UPI002AC907D2|nr:MULTISPECIES: phosphoribosylanthranilate isomerase [unclassified Pseudomonas]MEB0079473.1 phosphoribosylanthranilate isomerase [Pseudomonas sp. MH10out]MEB0093316.1 phosphoribosylanthranilate isomerase [Pseudomonas sp. CCI4.2]MEB0102502.1 phosphoribosylanthranilate isomerase [Pseudomonas sp. CCI3.2]MEB0122388.1 phosphoribosylanthranilate isomerase [Pseudomonas sp. CCI1.2]MEB0132444.1 phosphoribosylanthranilate isomerase [Pseudomonas sp. CCI2.4]
MSAVRSKICGITRIEDALAAVDAGADAIGFVFYAKSPRAVTAIQAREIIAALPPFVTTVGLFVNISRCELTEILEVVPLDLLQFHGDETAEDCDGYHRPYIKALRVRAGDDIAALCRAYPKASGVLLDTYVAGVPGGTGEAFDWSLIPHVLSKPIILAGGLSPANVAQAIAQVRPYAVDVSGGVEASKGIKDHDKIRAFMTAVQGSR